MINSSRDILNYALTLSVVVLTFFFAWILLYLVRTFRDMQRVVHDIIRAIEKLNEVLDYTREKISSAAALIPIVVKGTQKIIEIVGNVRNRQASKKAQREKPQSKNKENNDT